MRTAKGKTPGIVTVSFTATQAEQLLFLARERLEGFTPPAAYLDIGSGLPLAEAALKHCDEEDARWLVEPDVALYVSLLNAGVVDPDRAGCCDQEGEPLK